MQLGSVRPSLSTADLATRLYTFAASMAQENKILVAAKGNSDIIDDLPGVFNDLKIRLEGTFEVTKQQKVSLLNYVLSAHC